jgi:hypothetical protein
MSSNEDVEDELERRRCRQLLPHNQFVTAAAHGEIGYMKALIESHGDGLVEATYDEKVLERGECYYDEDRRHQVGRRYYLAKGWTALLAATTCQELEAVKYLVETCHANVEARDKEQFTPFILARSFGFLEIAQYLVLTGKANVEAKNDGGATPLHCATIEGHISIIKFLLEQGGADIAAKTNDGQTALSLRPNQNHDEIAEYLVSKMRGSIDI